MDNRKNSRPPTPSTSAKNCSQTAETNLLVPRHMEGRHRDETELCDGLLENARLRVFVAVLKRAWRCRRDEVKILKAQMATNKRWLVKSENKIHIYNTLYTVERKRTASLETQLDKALDKMSEMRSSSEALKATVCTLKADNNALEQRLSAKDRDIDALNSLLDQAKSDLTRSMESHQHLQAAMIEERTTMSILEFEKNKLLKEVCKLSLETNSAVEKYNLELIKKNAEAMQAQKRVAELKVRLAELNKLDQELQVARDNDTKMRQEVETLRQQVGELRGALDRTVGNRLQTAWQRVMGYQQKTLTMAHLFAFYLLPATPPPKKAF